MKRVTLWGAVLCVMLSVADLRTIRSKVVTSENGTRDVVVNNDSMSAAELEFLVKDLNGVEVTARPALVTTTTEIKQLLHHPTEPSNQLKQEQEFVPLASMVTKNNIRKSVLVVPKPKAVTSKEIQVLPTATTQQSTTFQEMIPVMTTLSAAPIQSASKAAEEEVRIITVHDVQSLHVTTATPQEAKEESTSGDLNVNSGKISMKGLKKRNEKESLSTGSSSEKPGRDVLLGKEVKKFNENVLMNNWHTLTEAGWKGERFSKPVRTMFINNTRVLKFLLPGDNKEVFVPSEIEDTKRPLRVPLTDEVKESRAIEQAQANNELEQDEESDENPSDDNDQEDEEALNVAEKEEDKKEENHDTKESEVKDKNGFARGIWKALGGVYRCVQQFPLQSGLLKCLVIRFHTFFHPLTSKSFNLDGNLIDFIEQQFSKNVSITDKNDTGRNSTARDMERKSFFLYKKILHSVLLPVLVVLVIKYLLALPLLVAGLLTMKTFWFSFFSAGLVAVANMMKKNYVVYQQPVKKVQSGIEVGGGPYYSPVPVQWPTSKQDDRLVRMMPLNENYYM